MKLTIKSRHTLPESLKKHHSDSVIIDVTSRGPEPWVRFSPYFPHGGIPVPFMDDAYGMSVEGIWQGLKVFESEDVDPAKLLVTDMKGLKRTVKRFGKVLGHRTGLNGSELLSYRKARYEIYLPAYLWVLENHLQKEIQEIRDINESKDIVLLDYETNSNIDNLDKPLSHAGLIKRYIKDYWPEFSEEEQ